MMQPYVSPILDALLPKLVASDARDEIASSVLQTLGALVRTAICSCLPLPPRLTCATVHQSAVGGEDMGRCIGAVVPIILTTLADKTSLQKRQIALRTLGQLVESTGAVIGGDCVRARTWR
jgi:FKBP12-rapamycin complex-associated protein